MKSCVKAICLFVDNIRLKVQLHDSQTIIPLVVITI